MERTGNLIEAGFWIVFGVVATLGLWRQAGRLTPFSLIAGLVVIMFGLSDLVESRTGAWWRPLWLLLWKAVCLTGMVVCYLKCRRARTVLALPRVKSSQAPSSSM